MDTSNSIPLHATRPATQAWVPEAEPVAEAAPVAHATALPVAEATSVETPNVQPLRERASCGLNFARFGLIWVIAAIVIAILILFAPLVEALVVAAILLVVCIIENAALGARLAANATVSVATDTLGVERNTIGVDLRPTHVVHRRLPTRVVHRTVHHGTHPRHMRNRRVNLGSTSRAPVNIGRPAMRPGRPLGGRVTTVGATQVRGPSHRPHSAMATRHLRGR